MHDEHFELDEVRFLEQEEVLEVPFRRIFHGRPPRAVRNWLLWATVEVDVLRCLLRVRHVKDCLVDDRSRIGTYSFNLLSYEDGALQIEACEDLTIWVRVDQLDVELYELGVRGKARIKRFLIVESYSGKVYE